MFDTPTGTKRPIELGTNLGHLLFRQEIFNNTEPVARELAIRRQVGGSVNRSPRMQIRSGRERAKHLNTRGVQCRAVDDPSSRKDRSQCPLQSITTP